MSIQSLDIFLNERGFNANNLENGSGQIPQQQIDLIRLINTGSAKTIMEIGFNAGHSADALLSSRPDITLVSFDIAIHKYIDVAKEYIDMKYPGRHVLIKGDSLTSVPQYIQDNPEKKFDLIFIDGCHEFRYAMSDLMNCRQLAHKDTIVALDDTSYRLQIGEWNQGPTLAWTLLSINNVINALSSAEYIPGRGMSWGKYNL
jgi:predicted O-methyltransferase YrrM